MKWHKWECSSKGCSCNDLSFIWRDEIDNLIYFEVARAGSSSIKRVIKDRFKRVPKNEVATLDYGNAFCFTTVRNPWDRMISNWALFSQTKIKMGRQPKAFKMPLDKFIERIKLKELLDHHWSPCLSFMHDNINNINMFFDCDHLTFQWNHLMHHYFDLPKLPHVRVGPKREDHYSTYYTDSELVETVGKLYKADIKTFGFEFERKE